MSENIWFPTKKSHVQDANPRTGADFEKEKNLNDARSANMRDEEN